MATGDFLELSATDDIRKCMECPFCNEIPLPPIYLCQIGHIICCKCRAKCGKCGLCSSKITDGRNFVFEHIIESSKFHCNFRDDGCYKVLSGLKLQQHLKECDYRSFSCHFRNADGCTSEAIPYSEYLNHLRDVHKSFSFNSTEDGEARVAIVIKLPIGIYGHWPFSLLMYDEQTFMIYKVVCNESVYLFVAIFGNDKLASAYSVKISFGKSQYLRFEATIPVVSIRRSRDEMLCAPFVSINEVHMKQMGTISTVDGEEHYTLEINYKILKCKEYERLI